LKGNRRRTLFIIIILFCVAVGTGTWWYWRPRGNHGNPSPSTAKVERHDLASTVLATGAVKPQVGAEVRVGARISGKVVRLYANIGGLVKRGQVLAELEKADLETQVSQRAAECRMAEAKLAAIKSLRPKEIEKTQTDVDQWQATVDLNRKDLVRQEALFKRGYTTEQARDQAKEQLAVSEAHLVSAVKVFDLAKTGYEEDLRQAVVEVERAKAVLADATVQLSYATITAPIDGVIGLVSTQAGETVAAGLNAPTFVTIMDLGRLQVDTFVDEVDIGKVRLGQKAIFTVDSFPSREFKGKVVAIYPKAVIQGNVVFYDVVVQINDKYDGLLRPEMTTSVTIFLDVRQNVLTVPVRALKRERGKSVVYVLANGRPQAKEVKVGWKDSQWVEIISGLEEGQTILLEVPPAEPSKP
jgi:multidrug efflux pump subunit AcrA (membrane-fusion protein)